jgi:hypothetical protein
VQSFQQLSAPVGQSAVAHPDPLSGSGRILRMTLLHKRPCEITQGIIPSVMQRPAGTTLPPERYFLCHPLYLVTDLQHSCRYNYPGVIFGHAMMATCISDYQSFNTEKMCLLR